MTEGKKYPMRKELQCLDCVTFRRGHVLCDMGEQVNRFDECDLKMVVSRTVADDGSLISSIEKAPLSVETTVDRVPLVPPLQVDTDTDTDPEHYQRISPQPYEVVKAWGLGYFQGSAIKYLARAGHKKGQTEEQDIRKAIRFLELYLEEK